jgi:hypothetical protein
MILFSVNARARRDEPSDRQRWPPHPPAAESRAENARIPFDWQPTGAAATFCAPSRRA